MLCSDGFWAFGPTVATGELTAGTGRVAIQRYVYDADGNPIESTYFGVDDKPVLCDGGTGPSLSEKVAKNETSSPFPAGP